MRKRRRPRCLCGERLKSDTRVQLTVDMDGDVWKYLKYMHIRGLVHTHTRPRCVSGRPRGKNPGSNKCTDSQALDSNSVLQGREAGLPRETWLVRGLG